MKFQYFQVFSNLSNYYFKENLCSPTIFALISIIHINRDIGDKLY